MHVELIALSLVALFAFPVVAYAVMWFASRERRNGRPEPPETNRSRRTIPGKRHRE